MWFMGHIMAVSGFLAEKGEQPVSEHFVGRKKSPGVTVAQCRASSLSVCNFSTPSPSFWPPRLCPSPSSVLGSFAPSSPFLFLSVSPAALFGVSLSGAWALLRVWVRGGLCQCRRCHFASFSLVRWRFNPFLTLHFHMLRQQSRLVAFLFFLNWDFVTGKQD